MLSWYWVGITPPKECVVTPFQWTQTVYTNTYLLLFISLVSLIKTDLMNAHFLHFFLATEELCRLWTAGQTLPT